MDLSQHQLFLPHQKKKKKKRKGKGKPLQMSYVVLIALKAFGWLVAKPPHKFWSLNIFIFIFFYKTLLKLRDKIILVLIK
jgi:hypothetical protein